MKYKTFETERLLIRPTSLEDAEFILEMLNSTTFIQNVGDRNVRTVKEAENYIKTKMHPQLVKLGHSNNTLILKENNQKIGTCGLYVRNGVEGIDIGYALLPAFEKNGYAFEAAIKIKDAGMNEFGIDEICAYTEKSNVSSKKLLMKLGMKLIGTTKLPDDEEVLLLYKT